MTLAIAVLLGIIGQSSGFGVCVGGVAVTSVPVPRFLPYLLLVTIWCWGCRVHEQYNLPSWPVSFWR